jgi:UDP-N-acetylglucosamine--N-acetylmuramyl-(pentapeptide) pyrophosphoryl-undecaprenol N-acetylglucosamine transferase
VHQSGEAAFANTRARYPDCGDGAEVVPFVDDVPALLARAGLVVCRAGGTTLAELAVMGAPALVCPYPHATNDHQRRNAVEFAAAGACIIADERELNDQGLATAVLRLLADGRQREQMSLAMRLLARPHAARRVADLIVQQLHEACKAA